MTLRALAKTIAYRSGALALEHAHRNRDVLTVAMFHRVLKPQSAEWPSADPTYTVSDELFADCLAFFKTYYRPVTIEQVVSALADGPPLPDRSLLVTFDDGWADNFDTALPLLKDAGVPAAVFVVPEAIEDESFSWWHETIFKAEREGRLSDDRIASLWRRVGPDMPVDALGIERVFAFIRRLRPLSEPERRAIVSELDSASPRVRQMMTEAQVKQMAAAGIAIGVHGFSHVPLTLAEAPGQELVSALRQLQAWLGADSVSARTLSFPHGRYNPSIVAMARMSGYRAQCTSDSHLNRMQAGRPASDLLGRISIMAKAITDERGRFRPELLAAWLFRRPVQGAV